MKNTLLYIVIAALAVLAVFYFMAGNSEPEAPVPADNANSGELSIPQEAATYWVDTENSELVWSAERIVGNAHTGTVQIASGQVTTENGTVTGGEFTLDMESIVDVENNERLIGHLKNEDFFNVAEYPTAQLVLKDVQEEAGNFSVVADLTIKDQTHQIAFPAQVTASEQGIEVAADFAIDRTLWDITYDSGSIFQQLGDKAIRDEVIFHLKLVLQAE